MEDQEVETTILHECQTNENDSELTAEEMFNADQPIVFKECLFLFWKGRRETGRNGYSLFHAKVCSTNLGHEFHRKYKMTEGIVYYKHEGETIEYQFQLDNEKNRDCKKRSVLFKAFKALTNAKAVIRTHVLMDGRLLRTLKMIPDKTKKKPIKSLDKIIFITDSEGNATDIDIDMAARIKMDYLY